jgi:site-specific recombinase XerD
MTCITTSDDITRFECALQEEERADATVEKYLRDLKRFLAYVGEEPFTKEKVIAYKNALKESYCLTSANSMLAALNRFLAFLGRNDLTVRPFKLQRESFRSAERELSREEYLRLTRAAQERGQTWLYLVMVTLCATGIRISELPFITVESLATRRATVRNKGKTRQVILPLELCRKLRKFAQERGVTKGSVFVTRGGKPIDRSNIHHAMKKLCAQAGVEPGKVFPHNLRHLFAVAHYEKHRDLAGLASILGHSSINTTRIYTMVTAEEKAQEISALGLVV